jgi:hypothetical protein
MPQNPGAFVMFAQRRQAPSRRLILNSSLFDVCLSCIGIVFFTIPQ